MTSYLKTYKRKITVTGPLGEREKIVSPAGQGLTCAGQLELEIPDYVNIEHDAATRRVELSVKDRDQRNQREMWGTPAQQAMVMLNKG
jgi:large subunit ribosomal protein L6